MLFEWKSGRRRLLSSAVYLLCGLAAAPAHAADSSVQQTASRVDPATPGAAPAGPSTNPTVNLINLLVKRGVLSKAEAAQLIKEANDEAAAAQATAAQLAETQKQTQAAAAAAATQAATQIAATQAAAKAAATQAAAAQATAQQTAAAQAAAVHAASVAQAAGKPVPPGAISVSYVPEVVKKQLREDVKNEVLAQAQSEGWAAPNQIPDWVSRLHPYGEVRMRFEGDYFPKGNDNTGITNFNAINTGSPVDVSTQALNTPPNLDDTEDRNRFRLRARAGVSSNLGDGWTTDFRIATGETDQPVSENQSLGAANNVQGGNFSKYAVWLDRAYIKYEPWKGDVNDPSFTVGRFDNPFFSTNLIWWEDPIAMDGGILQDKYKVARADTLFATIGAFPVYNTFFNYSTNQPSTSSNLESTNKWLFAGQAGDEWQINKDFKLKFGGAYYYFDNISGRQSDPCTVNSSADVCDTDALRPSFAQHGNTYMELRNIIPTATNGFGTEDQFQYFGLAAKFHELAFTSRLDYSHFDPLHIAFDGEFVDNLGFDRNAISAVAVNNLAGTSNGSVGPYAGGNIGYFLRMTVGAPVLAKRWDWNVNVGYRYVESDAVVDAFNDSDFALGGTNVKGYTIAGNLALSPNVWLMLRWMSSDAVAGSPYSIDIIQADINARF